jgi:hypothetical protein
LLTASGHRHEAGVDPAGRQAVARRHGAGSDVERRPACRRPYRPRSGQRLSHLERLVDPAALALAPSTTIRSSSSMSDKPLPPRPPLPDRPTADRQRSWTSQREPPAFGQGDDWSSGPSSPALSAFSPAAAWPPSHPASSTRLALPPSLLTAASALCRQARLRLTSKVRISSRRLRLARMAGCSSISASPSFCPTSLQVRRLCLQSSRYLPR